VLALPSGEPKIDKKENVIDRRGHDEVRGYGHGPNFRSDMVDRDPDIVDEWFRQYAIDRETLRGGA